MDVSTRRAVELTRLDVAMRSFPCHDGDEVGRAVLVHDAVGLAVSVDAPRRGDLVHVRDLQRPRRIGVGGDSYRVDAMTERYNFARCTSVGRIGDVGRVA